MSFEFIRKLPSPTEIKAEFPVPEKTAALKAERDKEIADVITGKSDKRFRKKSRIKLLLFLVYTQISHVQQAQVTRACYISLTLKRSLICLQGL